MKSLRIIGIKCLLVMSSMSFALFIVAQDQTVGLFQNHNNSFNGYTLFSPMGSHTTYLIDNCGMVVNTWISNCKPMLSVYLLENGDLLRTCKNPDPNIGGSLEILDWDGQIVWSYDFGSENLYLHHDIEILPNGNILAISRDVYTPAEAIAEGRDPSTLVAVFWAEKIIEIEPIGSNSMNIVWEWKAWDHIVQEYDPGANNYDIVADHPELLNINYSAASGPNGFKDWIHLNSITYNSELDQILLCSRNLSEVYIIDHSTTTAEAVGHSGGIYGKGGDILYRFGNPAAYNRGGPEDRLLFFQHDAQWIPEGTRDEKKIIVFNNQVDEDISSVDVFDPPMDSAGFYPFPFADAFGPDEFDWSFSSTDIFSTNLSGVQRLPNGNTLICSGKSGLFTEIDVDGNILWRYGSPVGGSGPVNQGEIPDFNSVFKVRRYSPAYEGFAGQQLFPGDPIELNPWPLDCSIIEDTIAEVELKAFLEGPFNVDVMSNSLNVLDILPLSQPFTGSPWYYNGTESLTMIPIIDISDWILVGFRDAETAPDATSSTTVDRKAAFLLKDGSVVNTDGTSLLTFYNSIENDIYVSLWHRNHLGIISSSPLSKNNNKLVYDFTTNENKVLGGLSGHKEIGTNIWGMFSGDGNSDGLINELDNGSLWSDYIGKKGLLQADYNLDGEVDNKDKNNHWHFNQTENSQVPE